MTQTRTAVQDFSTSNKIYVNAVVTFHTVLNGEKTNELANLYTSINGSELSANPQTLDSYGKFPQPIYIEEDVIGTVTGLGNTPDHDTGIISVESIRSEDVVISSSELLALDVTPKTLIEAQGSGRMALLDKIVYFLDYNSSAYSVDAGDDLTVRYTDGSGNIVSTLETTGFLDQTEDKYAISNSVEDSVIGAVNAPLVASLNSPILSGDSPIALRVYYRIVNLSTLLTS